jgi:hypothetical protein
MCCVERWAAAAPSAFFGARGGKQGEGGGDVGAIAVGGGVVDAERGKGEREAAMTLMSE